MNYQSIPIDRTGKFSKLIIDYSAKYEQLDSFIESQISIGNFGLKKESVNFSKEKRELIVARLIEQNKNLKKFNKRLVEKMLSSNTYTVTTGHQLCLFGGPQYFLSKIITTIKLAQDLKSNYPNCDFLPVFWMASEDHDFDEINSVKLFGKELKTSQIGLGPVGRLSASLFTDQLMELRNIVGESENGNSLIELFELAYNSSNSLSEATRIWVSELFGDTDLLILDGDDVELKKSFASIMKDELVVRQSNSIIENTSIKLKGLGYHQQVTSREINLFYIEDNVRERIVYVEGRYEVLNTEFSFSESEILSLLDKSPEKFSPNAVFRPVYQESILPNLAYIGGPGELAYWFQLKENFDRLNVSFPLLCLRDSYMVIQKKLHDQFTQLGFELSDVFLDEEELIKEYIKKHAGDEMHFEKEEELLENLKQQLLTKVEGVDGSLMGMVSAEMKGIEKLFTKLEKRLIKAQKAKEEVNIGKLRKFKKHVLPNNTLAEREQSFVPDYLKLGGNYFELIKGKSDIFTSVLHVVII